MKPPVIVRNNVAFEERCNKLGRVYKDRKCTRKCIKSEFEYNRGRCLKVIVKPIIKVPVVKPPVKKVKKITKIIPKNKPKVIFKKVVEVPLPRTPGKVTISKDGIPQCKGTEEYYSVRSKSCKLCSSLNTKGLRLSKIEIKNAPLPPYQTSYPLEIQYYSNEAGLPCINFEVQKVVAGV